MLLLILEICLSSHVSVCIGMWVPRETRGGTTPVVSVTGGSEPLDVWVLGTKLQPSANAASALNP